MTDIELISSIFITDKNPGYDPGDIPAKIFWKGSAFCRNSGEFVDFCQLRFKGDWEYITEWSDGFRAILINFEKKAILTYCEGDIDLTVDDNADTFNKRYIGIRNFYENLRK